MAALSSDRAVFSCISTPDALGPGDILATMLNEPYTLPWTKAIADTGQITKARHVRFESLHVGFNCRYRLQRFCKFRVNSPGLNAAINRQTEIGPDSGGDNPWREPVRTFEHWGSPDIK